MIENRDVLVRPHAATLGNPDAKVHIVEFLDPACAACATMHAEVKRLLALYPDKVRLTARHVAFHDGSDYAIKVLEAARKQGKYWQTLEALYAAQSSWVVDNVVRPPALWRAVEHLGLNAEQLKSDFYDPEVAEQFDQDIRDARLLRVAETPKFFVNARPVPRIGSASLQMAVRERIREEY
jgi:protein-disulfide isomerase